MAFPIAARFAHPDNGYKGDQDQAARHLTVGKVYVVTGIDVGRSSSRLFLDIPDAPTFGFNTVMFEPASVYDQDDEDSEPQPAPEEVAGEIVYLYHWRFDRGEEFGLYRHAADADARAAQHAGEGLSEVLSMAVLGRPEQPAPELAAAMAAIAEYERLADRLVIPNRIARAEIRKQAGLPS